MTLRTLIDQAIAWIGRSAVVLVPAAIGLVAWYFDVSVQPQLLLPAVALTTAALMGMSAITFTRLKDAAAVARPEVGADPATHAYLLFRRVNRAAVEALMLGGVCVVGVCVSDRWQWLSSVVILAGIAYVGLRLLAVLRALRVEAEHLVGDRYVVPSDDSQHIRIAK